MSHQEKLWVFIALGAILVKGEPQWHAVLPAIACCIIAVVHFVLWVHEGVEGGSHDRS